MRFAVLAMALAVGACDRLETESGPPVRVVDELELHRLPGVGLFSQVRDMDLRGDTIWVLDSSPPYVARVVLGVQTSTVRFSERGRGPGELWHPVAIQSTEAGAQVWDLGNNKVVEFDAVGGVEAVEALSDSGRSSRVRSDILDVSYVDPWRIRRLGARVLFTRFPNGMTHTSDATGGILTAADQRLDRGDPIAKYVDYVPRDASSLGQFAAMPLWDSCTDEVVVWDPRTRSVRWLDGAGQEVRVVATDLDSAPIGDAAAERYIRHVARLELGPSFAQDIDFRAEIRRLRPLFSAPGTAVVDVRCGGDGAAWMQLFDATTAHPLGRGPSWVRVDPIDAINAVRFPTGFQPMILNRDGRTVGVFETEAGQTLAIWRNESRSR